MYGGEPPTPQPNGFDPDDAKVVFVIVLGAMVFGLIWLATAN